MITTIIFDFAGVLTEENFMPVLARGLKSNHNINEAVFRTRFKEHEDSYMVGKVDSNFFWENTCKDFDIPYEDFVHTFISSYKWNEEMLSFVKKLKENYKIVLLSDNFDILSEKLRADKNLTDLFSQIYFSNEIQKAKKHRDSFEYVLTEISERAENCVFTDDKEKNLVHAEALGMKTIHFKNVEGFKQALFAFGIKF